MLDLNKEQVLADAFKEFTKASESIISYYGALESQICHLKTELQKKNEELEKSQKYLDNILNSLPIGVIVLDHKKIAFTNLNAQKLGVNILTPEITNGKKCGDISEELGIFRWKKDGLANDFEGKEVVVIEDVTELEKTKERTAREDRLMAMGEMAARIAHEIKNPLCSMELFISLLMDRKTTKKNREYLEYVQYGIKTIDRIVNNVLSFTRPKALVAKKDSIARIIRGVVDFMRISAQNRGVNIFFNSSYEGQSIFDADFIRLAGMNLISNAIEATEKNGVVDVTVKKTDSHVIIGVKDNGCGLPEKVRKNIFNPFFTTKDKGTGLGLFIVHNIIKAHGGYIEVEPSLPKGTIFNMYVPKGIGIDLRGNDK